MDLLKLNSNQIEIIKKGLFKSRITVTIILCFIMLPILLGINEGLGEYSGLGLKIVVDGIVALVFGGIWLRMWSRHQKILNNLSNETYSIFEGKVEDVSSGGATVMFQLNGVKHFLPRRFAEYCIKGSRVRLYKTDKTAIYFHVEEASQ